MIFTRGIARTAGRALAVKRANAALFGTTSVAPKTAPLFNSNSSRRQSCNPLSPSSSGMYFNIQLVINEQLPNYLLEKQIADDL
jgi:hypothetical protein